MRVVCNLRNENSKEHRLIDRSSSLALCVKRKYSFQVRFRVLLLLLIECKLPARARPKNWLNH